MKMKLFKGDVLIPLFRSFIFTNMRKTFNQILNILVLIPLFRSFIFTYCLFIEPVEERE